MDTFEEKQKRSIGSIIGGKLLSFDNHKTPFSMTFDGGKPSLATWSGAILSMILSTIVLGYSF